MASRYELWLTTPTGVRIKTIPRFFFLNYSRTIHVVGTCQIGIPFEDIGDIFQVDQRLEIWRSPATNTQMRLDATFFLQSKKIYQRVQDNAIIYELRGVSPITLLDRRIAPFRVNFPRIPSNEQQVIIFEEPADDGMKRMVRNHLGSLASDTNRDLTTTGFFSVQADVSAAADITWYLSFRNILEAFREIHEATVQRAEPVYFDIVPVDPSNFQFQTFMNLRGSDRRGTSLVFSVENGNIASPFIETSHFGERNYVYIRGHSGRVTDQLGRGDSERINKSIWNRRELFEDIGDVDSLEYAENVARKKLDENRPKERYFMKFISSPGGSGQPRSLYGLDWDLGDQVNANFAGIQFEPIVKIVYITVREDGNEEIHGRSSTGEDPSGGISA